MGQPVEEVVFVAVRKDKGDGEEWADLSTISYTHETTKKRAKAVREASWKKRNPLVRIAECELRET